MTRITMRESEAGFQQAVVDLATLHGWRWWHDNDSRRNKSGFPDLVLVRDGVLIFAELKSDKGRMRPEQVQWIAALTYVEAAADGRLVRMADDERGPVQVYVWRPVDWPKIVSILSRRR